jgi:protein involved in polysaccharide export with SLBB domain
VSVNGQVLRPAIYELKGGESVADLIALSGGLGPKAYPSNASIERIQNGGFLTVLDLDLTKARDLKLLLKSGDGLSVSAIKDRVESTVSLQGHVYYPGSFSWAEGMRLSDLISGLEQFPPGLDLDYAILSREDPLTGELLALLVSPGAVITEPGGTDDLRLHSKDKVMLFGITEPGGTDDLRLQSKDKEMLLGYDSARIEQLTPLIQQLESQARLDSAAKVVTISGPVRFPGKYPLTDQMDIKQLLNAAGGPNEEAYAGSVEIIREDLSNPELTKVEIKLADLSSQLRNTGEGFALKAKDLVFVKVRPEAGDMQSVTLQGEVVFPGQYVISRGETLLQVIERAGGFSEYGDIDAAFFTRVKLRENEVKRLAELEEKMAEEMAASQLGTSEENIDTAAFALQQDALDKLSDAQAIGRLIIPLRDIVAQREADVILADGDRLIIPMVSQAVTVIGEVYGETSHMFRRGRSLSNYIEMSGGFKDTADKRAIYMVKASGEMVIPRSSLFKFESMREQIEPGDTIVVPIDSNGTFKLLPVMAEVSKVIYELALGAAAINSF